MMNLNFKKEEALFIDLQTAFNGILQESYPECLEWNHYELWKHSGKQFTPYEWKEWRLDQRVDDWYASEILVIVKNRETKLLRSAGENKSVGEAQALSQISNYLERHEARAKPETKFIYTMIPLNFNEEAASNVKILNNIPIEIENGLTTISRDKR